MEVLANIFNNGPDLEEVRVAYMLTDIAGECDTLCLQFLFNNDHITVMPLQNCLCIWHPMSTMTNDYLVWRTYLISAGNSKCVRITILHHHIHS